MEAVARCVRIPHAHVVNHTDGSQIGNCSRPARGIHLTCYKARLNTLYSCPRLPRTQTLFIIPKFCTVCSWSFGTPPNMSSSSVRFIILALLGACFLWTAPVKALEETCQKIEELDLPPGVANIYPYSRSRFPMTLVFCCLCCHQLLTVS